MISRSRADEVTGLGPTVVTAASSETDQSVTDGLTVVLHEWLIEQPWFSADPSKIEEVRTVRSQPLSHAFPLVVWAVLGVRRFDGVVDLVQVFVALGREVPERVSDDAVIGEIPGRGDGFMAWSALADSRIALDLCREVAPDLAMTRVEHHATDRFSTQLIVDAHWVLAFPHRLEDGLHPDVEAGIELSSDVGAIAGARSVWHREGVDLAILRPIRVPATRASAVVDQHLRACLRRGESSGPPNRRDVDTFVTLGRSIAQFHVASARRFGTSRVTREDLAARAGRLWAARNGPADAAAWPAIERRLARIAPGTDLGLSLRIHGEMDLESLGRERDHWRLHGLGGGSGGAVARWREPASPLWDLASLIRAVERAAWSTSGVHGDPVASLVVEGWVERVIEALVFGYVSDADASALLPADRPSRDALLSVCEVIGRMVDVASSAGTTDLIRLSSRGGVAISPAAR